MLATAAVTTVVCQRLRIPVVVGYILAGILVGPASPILIVTDTEGIRTLSELGVILLMYSIGMEFSLRRLARLLPFVGPAAAVEIALMLVLGFVVGQGLGWPVRDSLFAGAMVAISSTMIVAKAFEDHRPPRRLEDLVLGILVMEDLVVMLLLVLLSTEASGARLSSHDVVATVGRLLGFLALILVGGMLLVPRAMRLVVSLRRNETTLVAAVGLAFLFAYLAHAAGFSVALGAFLAGALVRESGRAHQVLELLEPVRHVFAAIFFVAVGMLVSLPEAFRAWPAVLAFVAVVVIGKIVGVALGGFLSGFGVRTSIQAGMTLAQIGEFSFVIAGIGLTSGAVSAGLYPVAVTVSVITILLVPLLMRLADPLSATIDRRLPKPVQTFVTLYESWVELLRRQSRSGTAWRDIRRPVGWMVLDASVVTGVFLATTGFRAAVLGVLASLGLGATPSVAVLAAGSLLLALPFAVGLVTSARRVALRLGERAMPHTAGGVDQAHAPRGTLTAVVQIVLVVLFGLPFLVITQPFMSAWPGAAIIGGLLVLLTISFWRSARNLDSHARAGAELIVDVLARQGRDKDEHDLERVQEMLPGMGTIVAFHVEASCQSVGQSLGELNLRGLTGVTVVALIRGVQRLVFPKATEVLQEGDVLALTGSHEAIAAADRLLLGIEHAIPSGVSPVS